PQEHLKTASRKAVPHEPGGLEHDREIEIQVRIGGIAGMPEESLPGQISRQWCTEPCRPQGTLDRGRRAVEVSIAGERAASVEPEAGAVPVPARQASHSRYVLENSKIEDVG